MSDFTYKDAINAGLKTELMTVVIQPPPPDPPIIPTVLSGTYEMSGVKDSKMKFCGYEFKVNQDYLSAISISGRFRYTEEFMKFAEDLKDSGATLNLVDDFVGTVTKYAAPIAKANGLFYSLRREKTKIEGRFEISEGVITIYQKPFQFEDLSYGAFTTADDLIDFCSEFWKELNTFDKVQRMWARKNNRYLDRFYPAKFLK